MHGDVLGPVDEIGKVADPIPRQIPCGQIPCGRERCLSGLSPVCFCASGGRDEGSTALWDNYICAIAQRGTLTSRDLDRKSTRLNSSHVAISYAVFCLKKKI